MIGNPRTHSVVLGLGMCLFFAGQALAAEVYQGVAKFRNADGKQTSAKVTISIDGTALPEAERLAVVEKVRSNPESAKSVLAGLPQLGYIEANNRRVPIRFAHVSNLASGKNVTLISDEALGFIGGDKKDAKSKEGFDLTYAMITVKGSEIKGELGPATKVKWTESGAPAPERYGDKIVWIDDIKKVSQP